MSESSFLSEMVNNIIKSKPKIRPITEGEVRRMILHKEYSKICGLCGKHFGDHFYGQANCTLEVFHIKNE